MLSKAILDSSAWFSKCVSLATTMAPPKMVPVAREQPLTSPRTGAAAPPPRPAPAPPRPQAQQHRAPPSLFAEHAVEAPHDDLPTLFAEELISEKSLDEVILAFLSADLEPPK